MTALNTPSQVRNETRFDVYIKPFIGGGTPPEGGQLDSASNGENGWERASRLRFKKCEFAPWPSGGSAIFDRVPLDGVIEGFENGFFEFGPDDQVRVVMLHPSSETSIGPDLDVLLGEDTGIVVFEGTLQRADGSAFGANETSDEGETFHVTAFSSPEVDNEHPAHLIIGRFIAADDTPTPHLIDGQPVPCVFNADEQPNLRVDQTIVGDSGDSLRTEAALFTSEDDPEATYWTLKEALKHLIVCWMYGIKAAAGGDAQGALTRSATIEHETYQAIFGTPQDANVSRWEGLDSLLPEIDVQGLGVFDAIDRVCRAGGYRCSVLPIMGRKVPEAAHIDRLYQLRIWREGAGPQNQLLLQNRVDAANDGTADQLMSANNVSTVTVLRDTSRVRNSVIVCGRVLIETTVELKPLFSPDDIAAPVSTVSTREQALPSGLEGDPYHQRHVEGGRLYGDYKHVGRMWGLDETGTFYRNSLGYSGSSPYGHDDGGFDWLGHLGIDGGQGDGLTAARVGNGVTAPIRWSKRVRRPRVLTRPESIANGQSFRVDVSEDGGASWHELPQGTASLLTEGYFGIMLRAKNLAVINRLWFARSASKREASQPQESWWALLTDDPPLLRFRLTCLILADHSTRYDLPIDDGAATRTPRGIRVDTDITEVWQSPSSVLGDKTWMRLDHGGFTSSTVGADRTNNLKNLAERVQDERGQMRWSVAADHWHMDPSRITVGDVITGIGGRNLDFDRFSAASGKTRYPSVVSLSIEGHPVQNINYDIGDEAVRRGI